MTDSITSKIIAKNAEAERMFIQRNRENASRGTTNILGGAITALVGLSLFQAVTGLLSR